MGRENTMSSNPSAELMETTYNLYDADGRFRNNYPSIPEAKMDCDPGDTIVERHAVRVRRGRRYRAHRRRTTTRRRRLGTTPRRTRQSPPDSGDDYPQQDRRKLAFSTPVRSRG